MNKKSILILFVVILLIASAFYLYPQLKDSSSMVKKEDIVDSELIVKDSEYKLVFFGYANCYHFCDPRLKHIDYIYSKIKDDLDVSVLFIDISQESSLEEAVRFVGETNKEFQVINPDKDSIRLLQKKFQDVFISKMPDGEYLHSGFLYLLKQHNGKYYLIKTYLEFFKTLAVAEDIKNIAEK